MKAILLLQLYLIGFNIVNVFIDAYKIKVLNKTIRHGINFIAYAVCTGLIIWLAHLDRLHAVIFSASAFFNRQIFFDIPLNWRRGLKWDYVSLDRPPKALMDRIEVSIFGYDGKLPVLIYSLTWVGLLIIQWLLNA